MIEVPSGGERPGILEITSMSTDDAQSYADILWARTHRRRVLQDIPSFRQNFSRARVKTKHGTEQRRSMPVLDESDLPEIKALLSGCGDKILDYCDQRLIAPGELRPIQGQIYFDKAFVKTAQNGIPATLGWLRSRHIFTTHKRQIIDGHHGWLSAMLISPGEALMKEFRIGMPLEDLLPILRKFSDDHGRVRNA